MIKVNAEQKYNSIINYIENEIAKGTNAKARDIVLGIKTTFCVEPRSLSEVFDFLIEMPIVTYIKTRQLMKAAEIILAGGSNQDAIMYTGFSDEPSFIKAFTKEFSLSPSNFAKAENPKIYMPLTWNAVVEGEYKIIDSKEFRTLEKNETNVTEDTSVSEKFGIPIVSYKRIQEAENMQILYGFNDKLSNIACKIAERYNVETEAAFNLIKQLLKRYKNEKVITKDYENWIKKLDDMIWFYFQLNDAALFREIPFNAAIDIYGTVKDKGVRNLQKKHFETLARYYDSSEDTGLPTLGDVVGTISYTCPDDYEDFFDLYAAYEPYNPYDD